MRSAAKLSTPRRTARSLEEEGTKALLRPVHRDNLQLAHITDDTGVVNGDVEPAVLGPDGGERRDALLGVRDVQLEDEEALVTRDVGEGGGFADSCDGDVTRGEDLVDECALRDARAKRQNEMGCEGLGGETYAEAA